MEVLKSILQLIPEGIISGLALNGTLIVLAYFLVWKKYKERLRNWRIQLKEKVNNTQIRRELKNSLYTLLVGASFSAVVIYLSTLGYTKIYIDITEYNLFYSIFGFFILLIIDDTWFYWIHRLLHHPRLYRFVHREHHKSIDTNPFTSMSFHFLEPLLLSLLILPVSFVFPIYAPVLLALQVWGILDNIKAHLGYELYPSWWNRGTFRFMTSSTHHNMHHSKFKGNYGLHFRFWDRLTGTEFVDYEREYDKIQERKNKNP